MIESLVLIEGNRVSEEMLEGVSLMNAKQGVIGSTPRNSVVLHVAANSNADLGNALLEFAAVPDVKNVLLLAVQNLP